MGTIVRRLSDERSFKYCLSYDVKNSKEVKEDKTLRNDGLKIEILQRLKDKGATNFENPVASTLVFTTKGYSSQFKEWHEYIDENFGEIMHYYLCSVEIIDDAPNGFMDANSPDPELVKRFNDEVLSKIE